MEGGREQRSLCIKKLQWTLSDQDSCLTGPHFSALGFGPDPLRSLRLHISRFISSSKWK